MIALFLQLDCQVIDQIIKTQ